MQTWACITALPSFANAHLLHSRMCTPQEWCNTTMGEALRQSLLHNKESHDPQMDLLLTLLNDVVQGVEYLHSKNIIHGGVMGHDVSHFVSLFSLGMRHSRVV